MTDLFVNASFGRSGGSLHGKGCSFHWTQARQRCFILRTKEEKDSALARDHGRTPFAMGMLLERQSGDEQGS